MQPHHAAALSASSLGSGRLRTMSLTATRPPFRRRRVEVDAGHEAAGLRTHAISRNTAALSGARLMTPLLFVDGTHQITVGHPASAGAMGAVSMLSPK